MPTISHQTVRLSHGRHASPEHGMCVMELASVLAGEPFSDHPHSVSPVIATALRAYNDHVDDSRRQGLIAIAAQAVGTRGCWRVERELSERIRRWAAGTPWGGRRPWWLRSVSSCAVLAARDVDRHAAFLAFIGELLGAQDDWTALSERRRSRPDAATVDPLM
jgi:hypothetical protein